MKKKAPWSILKVSLFGAIAGSTYSIYQILSGEVVGTAAFVSGSVVGGAVAGAFICGVIAGIRNFIMK